MKTSHIVYLTDIGVDVGSEVILMVTSDEKNKLFFKNNGPFMVDAEELDAARRLLNEHILLDIGEKLREISDRQKEREEERNSILVEEL